MKKWLALCLLFLTTLISFAQVRPGELYDSGEEVYGPKLGVKTMVPEGWAGVLPMNTEVFLLMPKNNSFGQIYVMGGEDSYETLKERWVDGVELDNGLFIKASEEPSYRNGSLISKLEVTGNNSFSGYVEAKCGDYGNCLVAILFAPPNLVDNLSNAIISFMDNMTFSEPMDISPYADFDWSEFLGKKYMASYERLQGSKKESEIWLCPDGTFKSKLKRKGSFAGEGKEYMGSKNGTWEVDNRGPSTILRLHFRNLTPVEISLLIEEEKIYVNGTRFFAMQDDTCK